MEVRAVDSGEPHQQTTSTLVTVTVQDVNNKPPVFEQELYTAYVLENELQGHWVLTVIATDQDRNAELEYDIIEPIVARDKSGTELDWRTWQPSTTRPPSRLSRGAARSRSTRSCRTTRRR